MRRLEDQVILLLFCFTSILHVPLSLEYILAFFFAVSIGCACYFFSSKPFCILVSLGYLLGCFWFPSLLIFVPIVLYNVLWFHFYLWQAIVFGYLCAIITFFPLPMIAYLFIGCILSFYLEYRTTHYDMLQKNFRKTRDDSTELNLLLKEKNHTLIEKQDAQVYAATLKERNRIAREIHDNVGHVLSRSILMVGALKAINQQETMSQPLSDLSDTLSDGMNRIRESVHDLHDDVVNLKESLETLIDDFDFCPLEFTYDVSLHVPKDVKYSFITITKEALSNVIKHSNATKVLLQVHEHPSMYQLIIHDNGTKVTSYEDTDGIGLTNMKDRIHALHGNIQFSNNQGFQIFITIPKKGTIYD